MSQGKANMSNFHVFC